MAYDIYGCDADVLDPVCEACTDVELGRVRSVVFLTKTLLDAALDDPGEWLRPQFKDQIKTIPLVTGTFDGGSPVEIAGFGDEDSKIIAYNFVLNFKDPNFKNNAAFWNSISQASGWYVAFRTDKQMRYSSAPVTVVLKSPIEEDKASPVVWDIEVRFSQKLHPIAIPIPDGAFTCTTPTP